MKLTFICKEIFKIKHEILARVFLAYLCINVEVYEKCRKGTRFLSQKIPEIIEFLMKIGRYNSKECDE